MAYVTDPELLKALEGKVGGRNAPSTEPTQAAPVQEAPVQQAPSAPAPDRGFFGNVANAWDRGRTELASGLMGVGAAARADDAGKVTKESYHARELSRKLREHGEKKQQYAVESWRDIGGLGDAATFAAEQLVSGLPSMVGDIVTAPTTYTPTAGSIYAEQKGEGNTNIARGAGLASAGLGLVPYGRPFAKAASRSVAGRMAENIGVGALGGVGSGAAYDAGRNETTDGMFDNALDYAITGGTVAGAIRAPIEVAGSIKRIGSRSSQMTEDLGGVPGLNEDTRLDAMRNLHVDDQLNTMAGKTDLTPEQRDIIIERRKEVNDNIGTSAAFKAFGDLMDEGVSLSPEALRGITVRKGLSELSPEVMSGTALFGVPENAPDLAAGRRKRSEWGVTGEHGLLGKQFSKEELATHRKLGKQSQAKDVAPFEDVVAQLQDQLAEFQVLGRDGVIEPQAARRQEAALRGMISDSRSIVKAMHDTASERSMVYDQIALRAEELSKKFDEFGITVGGKGFNPAMNASSFIYKDKFLHNQDPAYRFGIKDYQDPALNLLQAGKAVASYKSLGTTEIPGIMARYGEKKARQKMADDFNKLRKLAAKNGLEVDIRPKAPEPEPTPPPVEPVREEAPVAQPLRQEEVQAAPLQVVPEEAPIARTEAPEPTIRSVEDQPFVVNPDGSIARRGSPDDIVSLARDQASAEAALTRRPTEPAPPVEELPAMTAEDAPVAVPKGLEELRALADTDILDGSRRIPESLEEIAPAPVEPEVAPVVEAVAPEPVVRDPSELQRIASASELVDMPSRPRPALEQIVEPQIRPEPLPRDPSEFQRLAMGEDTLSNLNRTVQEEAPAPVPEPVVAEPVVEAPVAPREVPTDLVRMAADEGVTTRTEPTPVKPKGSMLERAMAETDTIRSQRVKAARQKLEDKARKQGLSEEDIAKITDESQTSEMVKSRKAENVAKAQEEAKVKADEIREAVGEDPTVEMVNRQNKYFDDLADRYNIDRNTLEDFQTPYIDLSTNRMRQLTNAEHKALVKEMQRERNAINKNVETPEESATRQMQDDAVDQIYRQHDALFDYAKSLDMPLESVAHMMDASFLERTAPLSQREFTSLANKIFTRSERLSNNEARANVQRLRENKAKLREQTAAEEKRIRQEAAKAKAEAVAEEKRLRQEKADAKEIERAREKAERKQKQAEKDIRIAKDREVKLQKQADAEIKAEERKAAQKIEKAKEHEAKLQQIAEKAKLLDAPIKALQEDVRSVKTEQKAQRDVLNELVKTSTPEQLANIANELKNDIATASTSMLNTLKNFGSEVSRVGKSSPDVDKLIHQAETMHSVLDGINKRRHQGYGKVVNGANGLYTMEMKRKLQAAFGSGETTNYTGPANQRAVALAYGIYDPSKLPALWDNLTQYKMALDAQTGILGKVTSETTGESLKPVKMTPADFVEPVAPVQPARIAETQKASAPKSPNVAEEAFGQEMNPEARVGDDSVTVVENNPDATPVASLQPVLENLKQAVDDGRVSREDAVRAVDDAVKSPELMNAKETVPSEITKDAPSLAEDDNVKIVSPYEVAEGVDNVGTAFDKGYEFALIDPDKETIVRYAKNEKAADALAKKFGYGVIGITALFSGSAMAGGLMSAYGDKLGQRESGGNYGIENTLGYVGKYQFGWPALVDLGVIKASGRTGRGQKSILGDKNNFTGKYGIKSKEDFLNNPEAQEALFEEWNNMLDRRTRNLGLDKYIGQTVDGVPVTLEGIRAASHLLGHGAVKKALQSGSLNQRDGYGTTMSEYMRLGNSVAGLA